jgi:uncharacterized cysteine cluster protein YcgN (CxxCxxCC family)
VAYFDGDFNQEELELMHIQFLSDVGNWLDLCEMCGGCCYFVP